MLPPANTGKAAVAPSRAPSTEGLPLTRVPRRSRGRPCRADEVGTNITMLRRSFLLGIPLWVRRPRRANPGPHTERCGVGRRHTAAQREGGQDRDERGRQAATRRRPARREGFARGAALGGGRELRQSDQFGMAIPNRPVALELGGGRGLRARGWPSGS